MRSNFAQATPAPARAAAAAAAYSNDALIIDDAGARRRAAVDAAEAADTGGYRGPWAALQRIDLCDNHIDSAGGLEVLLALPSIAEVGLRGNPGFMGRHNAGREYLQFRVHGQFALI